MENQRVERQVREYRIGGAGVLRFDPKDPKVYVRFAEAAEQIRAVEEKLVGNVLTAEAADLQIKQILSGVFGEENDFTQILDGIPLLATGSNGQRILDNLFAALQPILEAGVLEFAREEAARIRKGEMA